MRRRCPDCYGPLSGSLWCPTCEFAFFDCRICGKVYGEESDAADCEYDHRTVLDEMVEAIDGG